jgi:hypothetical protein
MRVASVTSEGVQVIVYKNGDYFYENGDRVPEEKRKGFNSTIFRDPSKPRRPIVEAELDELTKKLREIGKQEITNKSE